MFLAVSFLSVIVATSLSTALPPVHSASEDLSIEELEKLGLRWGDQDGEAKIWTEGEPFVVLSITEGDVKALPLIPGCPGRSLNHFQAPIFISMIKFLAKFERGGPELCTPSSACPDPPPPCPK